MMQSSLIALQRKDHDCITIDVLSQALQRKDQDIVNAMKLVRMSKKRLQIMRENGWSSLLDEVSIFCGINEIVIPNMDDIFVVRE